MGESGASVRGGGESGAGGDPLDRVLVALVARVQSGDRAAMADLLALIRPRVLRYVRARLGPARDAFVSTEDVAQEACLAVVKAIPGYRWDGRPFMAFVYAIAGYKITDVFRSCSRERSDPVWELADRPDGAPGPEQRLLDRERGDWAAALVATLPVAQREILYLRVMLGFSAEETSRALGPTSGAIRVAQHRALNTLRRKVKGK